MAGCAVATAGCIWGDDGPIADDTLADDENTTYTFEASSGDTLEIWLAPNNDDTLVDYTLRTPDGSVMETDGPTEDEIDTSVDVEDDGEHTCTVGVSVPPEASEGDGSADVSIELD